MNHARLKYVLHVPSGASNSATTLGILTTTTYGVGQFTDYLFAAEGYMHDLSIVFEPKYADFQSDVNTEIETYAMSLKRDVM